MTSIAAATTAYVNGSAFLQTIKTSGNWLLDASSAASSDWMDPSSSGPDAVELAASAFAGAHVTAITYGSNFAVNKGILALQGQLNSQPGSQVNIFA
jgi:hypothetical protein